MTKWPTTEERWERFWSKVAKTDGCWLWTGATFHNGYGAYNWGGAKRVHRLAYEYCNGEIPAGLQVLHKCDTRACVNPEHLFLGTDKDNKADMHEKNRIARDPITGQYTAQTYEV